MNEKDKSRILHQELSFFIAINILTRHFVSNIESDASINNIHAQTIHVQRIETN